MKLPKALTISATETLALLDGPFVSMKEAVANDSYAFWLGSGISRDRMPLLGTIVRRALEFLRTRSADPSHRKALEAALSLAVLSDEEKSRSDLALDVDEWPDIELIESRLIEKYSKLLDIEVDGQKADYLLWEGVKVVETYGNEHTEPDIEHIGLALLILEGAASELATANWDGLIEKAVLQLSGNPNVLRVVVSPEDTQKPKLFAVLYKFHGCAVLAGQDENEHRDRLVARESQIDNWAGRAENTIIADKLIDLATSKRTLMLGLSAQDANIRGIFGAAEQRMQWGWPIDPAACVFAEETLGATQQTVLRHVYRAHYEMGTRVAIQASAHLQAFAKPLLIALWLCVLEQKARALLALADGTLPVAERDLLANGLSAFRDAAAAQCKFANRAEFLDIAIDAMTRALSLFRYGRESDGKRYEAATAMPVLRFHADPLIKPSGLPELAISLAIIGKKVGRHDWSLSVLPAGRDRPGAFKIETTAGRKSEVFFAATPASAARLTQSGMVIEEDDAIILHSQELIPRMTRSPRAPLGRKGRPGLREMSICALMASEDSAADLETRFLEQAGL